MSASSPTRRLPSSTSPSLGESLCWSAWRLNALCPSKSRSGRTVYARPRPAIFHHYESFSFCAINTPGYSARKETASPLQRRVHLLFARARMEWLPCETSLSSSRPGVERRLFGLCDDLQVTVVAHLRFPQKRDASLGCSLKPSRNERRACAVRHRSKNYR